MEMSASVRPIISIRLNIKKLSSLNNTMMSLNMVDFNDRSYLHPTDTSRTTFFITATADWQ